MDVESCGCLLCVLIADSLCGGTRFVRRGFYATSVDGIRALVALRFRQYVAAPCKLPVTALRNGTTNPCGRKPPHWCPPNFPAAYFTPFAQGTTCHPKPRRA